LDPRGEPEAERVRDPARARGQPLPLHGLPQHRSRRPGGCGHPVSALGQAVLRKEDAKLLVGQGRYLDDLSLPGMLWMSIVRSPYAHARIQSIDVSAARAAPGVVAAFSGADLADDVPAGLPCAWPVTEDIRM